MPRIDRDGVDLTFLRRKTMALLVYLAVTGRPHSRGTIAALLWGDLPQEKAAANLRKILVDLRNHASTLVLITRDTVAFNSGCCRYLDIVAFERAVDAGLAHADAGTLNAAVQLYQGDFLEGFSVPDAVAFDDWALLYREHLRDRLADALRALAEGCAREGNYRDAIAAARRMLVLDPWREEVHRLLMTLYAHAGERTSAIMQYRLCERVLIEELGVAPVQDTTALYRHILAGVCPGESRMPLR
jgi:DNA-binding SARP family transcriptional activator